MDIRNRQLIRDFARRHPRSRSPLGRWEDITSAAVWRNVLDVQASFPSAEDVRGWIVFNIHGNAYRLAAFIRYPQQQVIVHRIMTHSQYDRWQP